MEAKNSDENKDEKRNGSCEKYESCGRDISDLNDLPTYGQIAQHLIFLKAFSSKGYNDEDKLKYNLCAKVVMDIWSRIKPDVQLRDESSICKKIIKFRKDLVLFNGKRMTMVRKRNMTDNKDRLFDISACYCTLPMVSCEKFNCIDEDCTTLHFDCECKIDPEKKIPNEETSLSRKLVS